MDPIVKLLAMFSAERVLRVIDAHDPGAMASIASKLNEKLYRRKRPLKERLDAFRADLGEEHYAKLCSNASFPEMFEKWEVERLKGNRDLLRSEFIAVIAEARKRDVAGAKDVGDDEVDALLATICST